MPRLSTPSAARLLAMDPLQCADALLRAAREVPFEADRADQWRKAFVENVRRAAAALDRAAFGSDDTRGWVRLRSEVAALLTQIEGVAQIALKDMVEACERTMLLEIAVAHRSRTQARQLEPPLGRAEIVAQALRTG